MKTFTKAAVTSLFLACASTGYAGGGGHDDLLCIPVDGTVTSTAILCSDIPPEVTPALCPQGIFDPSQPGDFVPGMCLPAQPLPDSGCFRIAGTGKAKIDGDYSYSRLITVPAADQSGQVFTPLGFPPFPDDARSQLIVFTSNAVLTGKIRKYTGTLYTKDTGVITAPTEPRSTQTVGQVLKIVGGAPETDFDGATGMIAVAGEEVGPGAFYTGEVCVQRKK